LSDIWKPSSSEKETRLPLPVLTMQFVRTTSQNYLRRFCWMSLKLKRFGAISRVESIPNKIAPCIDAATAEPTRQSNQWLSGCSGRCFHSSTLRLRGGRLGCQILVSSDLLSQLMLLNATGVSRCLGGDFALSRIVSCKLSDIRLPQIRQKKWSSICRVTRKMTSRTNLNSKNFAKT
jgi:hypothetical protein